MFRSNDIGLFMRSIEALILVPAVVMISLHLGVYFLAPEWLYAQPSFLMILFEFILLSLLLIRVKQGIDPSPSKLENLAGTLPSSTNRN